MVSDELFHIGTTKAEHLPSIVSRSKMHGGDTWVSAGGVGLYPIKRDAQPLRYFTGI